MPTKKSEPRVSKPELAKNAAPVKTIKNDAWLDIKGQALYRGAMVAVPVADTGNTDPKIPTVTLRLGFVTKMTNKTIHVTTITQDGIDKQTNKCLVTQHKHTFPRNNTALSIIERSQLKLMDGFHEALRFAAGSVAD